MKSRTSFFNGRLLLKDITRFAPAWGLYTVCLMMGMLLMYEDGDYRFAANLAVCINIMPLVNLGYGLLTAQLLFGDLFQSRMCNALHALPLRREGWFAVHFTAGILFSVVPTALMAGLSVPILLSTPMERAGMIALWWFLGTNAQYLFFFGSAMLAVFCSGSRFAAAVVYGILQFGAMLVYFLVNAIYIPMLYGVECQIEAFRVFCPIVQMFSVEFVDSTWIRDTYHEVVSGSFALTEGWSYLWLCAGLGLVFSGLSLVLYRSRKLERAGDFLAVSWLSPVFLLLYCMSAAAMFQFSQSFFGVASSRLPLFMAIGLVVGWFTGNMLLDRSTRVFGLKKWIGLGVLLLAVGCSLVLTWLDPMGVERRVPQLSEVKTITIHEGYEYGHSITLEEEADLQRALQLHTLALDERAGEENGFLAPDGTIHGYGDEDNWDELGKDEYFDITYQLKNGSRLHRRYAVWSTTQAGDLLRGLTSRPEYLLDQDALPTQVRKIERFRIDGTPLPEELWTEDVVLELMAAIEADCVAGVLAPDSNFHPMYVDPEQQIYNYWLALEADGKDYRFTIYADSRECLAWMDRYNLRQLASESSK